MRIFPKVATAIFCTFMGLMILVTATAYNRRSGHTGLDMAKIKELRYGTETNQEPITKNHQDKESILVIP